MDEQEQQHTVSLNVDGVAEQIAKEWYNSLTAFEQTEALRLLKAKLIYLQHVDLKQLYEKTEGLSNNLQKLENV